MKKSKLSILATIFAIADQEFKAIVPIFHLDPVSQTVEILAFSSIEALIAGLTHTDPAPVAAPAVAVSTTVSAPAA